MSRALRVLRRKRTPAPGAAGGAHGDEAGRQPLRSTAPADRAGADSTWHPALTPAREKHTSTIDRIVLSNSRQGATAPSGPDALAGCSLS
jgi:hypothetical protein